MLVEGNAFVLKEPEVRYERRPNPLLPKSFAFAIACGRVAMKLCDGRQTYPIGQQLLRSSSLVGANVEEANGAYSGKDFAHKMGIALKEARESGYWLRYCRELELIDQVTFNTLHPQAEELIRILSAIVRTSLAKFAAAKSPPKR